MTKEDFLNMPEVEEKRKEIDKLKNRGLNISDVKDGQGNQYINLVQEGGGVLGIALVGFTYVLEYAGIRFWRLAGTSAGAINTMYLAAIKQKNEAKSEEILNLLANANLESFADGHPIVLRSIKAMMNKGNTVLMSAKYLGLGFILLFLGLGINCFFKNEVLSNILLTFFVLYLFLIGILIFYWWRFKRRNYGLCRGIAFHDWLKQNLEQNDAGTFKELKKKAYVSPESLSIVYDDKEDKLPDSDITLISCDISNQLKVEFPKDMELYDLSDETHPADFVRSSMSIPIFYETHKILNRSHKDEEFATKFQKKAPNYNPKHKNHLVDGGVVSNFPINIFHNPKISKPRLPVIGLVLEEAGNGKNDPLKSLMGFVLNLFNTIRYHSDAEFLKKNEFYRKHSVHSIDVNGFNWLNFSMTDKEKQQLFLRGVEAGVECLKKFDWEKYKEERSKL